VVDQNELPLPPKITREDASKMYEALRSGEESRRRIRLTIGRSILQEAGAPASPYGVLARARRSAAGARSAATEATAQASCW